MPGAAAHRLICATRKRSNQLTTTPLQRRLRLTEEDCAAAAILVNKDIDRVAILHAQLQYRNSEGSNQSNATARIFLCNSTANGKEGNEINTDQELWGGRHAA